MYQSVRNATYQDAIYFELNSDLQGLCQFFCDLQDIQMVTALQAGCAARSGACKVVWPKLQGRGRSASFQPFCLVSSRCRPFAAVAAESQRMGHGHPLQRQLADSLLQWSSCMVSKLQLSTVQAHCDQLLQSLAAACYWSVYSTLTSTIAIYHM